MIKRHVLYLSVLKMVFSSLSYLIIECSGLLQIRHSKESCQALIAGWVVITSLVVSCLPRKKNRKRSANSLFSLPKNKATMIFRNFLADSKTNTSSFNAFFII